MTLGTNATLAERLIYAPGEVDTDELLAALHELEGWRELDDELNISSPYDVKKACDEAEDAKLLNEAWKELEEIGIFEPRDVKFLKEKCEAQTDTISELEDEIARLNEIVAGLEETNFNLRTENQILG
jgi:hypothetical protein